MVESKMKEISQHEVRWIAISDGRPIDYRPQKATISEEMLQ